MNNTYLRVFIVWERPLLCHYDINDWLSIMMAHGTMYVLSQVFTADMNVLGADQRRGALPGVVPLTNSCLFKAFRYAQEQ